MRDSELVSESKTYIETPILFLIYNRPDTAEQVFNAIRRVKPKKLYVASDAPRQNHPEDVDLCRQSRELINKIDWDCELHTRFLEINLGGCDPAVRSEISWFFEYEDKGIILEDDIVPNDDFFYFCEFLLEKYENTKEVMMISGYNPVSHLQEVRGADYYFSRWAQIWGWATWKDRWELLDTDFNNGFQFLDAWYSDQYFKKSYEFQEDFGFACECVIRDNMHASWDLQWCYTLEKNKGVCIIPRVNLITNVGQYGVHSNDVKKKNPLLYLPTQQIHPQSLQHPETIISNKNLDTIRFNYHYQARLKYRFCLKLFHYLRKIGINPYIIHRTIISISETRYKK